MPEQVAAPKDSGIHGSPIALALFCNAKLIVSVEQSQQKLPLVASPEPRQSHVTLMEQLAEWLLIASKPQSAKALWLPSRPPYCEGVQAKKGHTWPLPIIAQQDTQG